MNAMHVKNISVKAITIVVSAVIISPKVMSRMFGWLLRIAQMKNSVVIVGV